MTAVSTAKAPSIKLDARDIKILATDISRSALAYAREARYSDTEVGRGVTPEQRTRYFRRVPGGWVVDEALRRRFSADS